MLELKPQLTRLDAEWVYSSVSRKKCQQSKKPQERVTANAPVITFISGCGERDGGVTGQKAATPSDCILTSAGATPADISVFAETKNLYFWQVVRASPAVFVCEINTFFFFCFWTLPAKTGILGRPAVFEPKRDRSVSTAR